jgi:hypothetical protein
MFDCHNDPLNAKNALLKKHLSLHSGFLALLSSGSLAQPDRVAMTSFLVNGVIHNNRTPDGVRSLARAHIHTDTEGITPSPIGNINSMTGMRG